jgi:cytoskeletal protein RodZ
MGRLGQRLRKTDQTSEQEEEMPFPETQATRGELGALLRQTREEKRIPLERVEEQTRIRQKYLLALEEGRYDDLPTPGHVHGFMRNYARYLDLDMEEVETLYARDRAAHRHFEPRIFHPKNITLLPKQPLIKADMVLSIVIVVLLAAAGFLFWQYGWPVVRPLLPMVGLSVPVPTATRELPTATQPAPTRIVAAATRTGVPTVEQDGVASAKATTATSTPEPTATSTPQPTATPTLDSPLVLATPTPEPTSTPTPTPTRDAGVLVAATFIDRVWLQVTIDGQEAPGSMYEAGDEAEWAADDTIYMICGNAGGIEVAVNGEELGVLGARAEVVEKLWGPQGEMTPTPMAPPGPSLGADGTPTATPVPGQAG